MQKQVCVIDLSGCEITAGILINNQFELIDLNLPWEVGFRQETDDRLVACFGDAFKRLDSNNSKEVRFTALDVHLKDIDDVQTLQYIFGAFLEEIFHRRLPEHGYSIEAMSVYVITPYQWEPVHRQLLRSVFKRIEGEYSVAGFNAPKVFLRNILSQILCLSIYFQKHIFARSYLFLIDFTRHDLILYQLFCEQLANSVKVELRDMLRFTDFFMDVEKQVSDVQSVLQTVGIILPISVGFSGRIEDADTKPIVELLKARCSATILEPQETATLLGGAELIRQFEEKSLVKPIHFVYQFCFGVQLPDGKWLELVPKTWEPPYHRKKAFRITGVLEKFDVHLFCGLSLTENSDVHRLATLEIDFSDDSNFSSRNPPEFILSITLDDFTHGRFAVHFPHTHEPSSVEFTVPVLMD
jgi:hypothetical protein